MNESVIVHDWTGSSCEKTLKLLVHKVGEFIMKFINPQINEWKIIKPKSRRIHNTNKQHTYTESDEYKIP